MIRSRLVIALTLLIIVIFSVSSFAESNLDILLAGLNDSDWRVRRDAALAIGELGIMNESVREGLSRALYDEDSNVRWAAVRALISLAEDGVPLLVEAVTVHPDPGVRKWAVEGLGEIGAAAESGVPALIQVLRDDNRDLRLAAVNALGKIGAGAKEAVPELALLLGGEFNEMMAANRALKQIDPQADLVAVLLEAIKSNSPDTAAKAAGALGGLGSKARSAIPFLVEMLTDNDPNLRVASVRALGAIGSAAGEAIPYIIQLLQDSDDRVRAETAASLGEIKSKPELVVPALTDVVFDQIPEVRRAALRAIKAFGDKAKDAAPVVALGIGDEDEVIRRLVTEVLDTIASKESIPSLVASLMTENDDKTRERAVIALGYVQEDREDAVELLTKALQDHSPEVRARAALALGYHQEYAVRAVPDLIQAAKDPNLQVSWAAVISLGQIDANIIPQIVRELGPDHLPVLIEAVQHDDSGVRETAAAILQEMADEIDLVNSMLAMVRDGEKLVKLRAIQVLRALGLETSGVFGALVMAIVDRNPEVANLARESLLDLTGERSLLPILACALKDESPEVREVAQKLAGDYPALYAMIEHDKMVIEIGKPAIIEPGDNLPVVNVSVIRDGVLKVKVVLNENEIIEESERVLTAGSQLALGIEDDQAELGTYRIELEYMPNSGKPICDAFYFTIQDPKLLPENSSRIAYIGPNGKMVYVPDYKGNRIPDFSYVGYMAGYRPIPDVPVKVVVEPGPGDDTARIQAAIDQVSALPLDENGFRGAVLLKAGIYEVAGTVRITTSGVVLRGEGRGKVSLEKEPLPPGPLEEFKKQIANDEGTIILATGLAIRPLIQVQGSSGIQAVPNSTQRILDMYVPVGARSFRVENPDAFQVGDTIIVQRHGNAQWISEIGMDRIPPRSDGKPITQWSPFTLEYDRVITAIEGNVITVDAPIVNAIEEQWGGGSVYKYTDPGRIYNVGVEGIRAVSIWTPDEHNKDHTRHADVFVMFDNAKNVWVRDVTTEHFLFALVRATSSVKWITVQNTAALLANNDPYYTDLPGVVEGRVYLETGVYTGRSNYNLSSQLTLVRDAYAVNNRHAFCIQSRVAGPNVFLDCVQIGPYLWASEPHQRWSTGGLYDNVHDRISIINRGNMGSGHGWAGANYVVWNSEGSLAAQSPPTAQTWVIGHVGTVDRYQTNMGGPPAYKESWGVHVQPRSLYLQQLQDREAHGMQTE